MSVAGLVTTLLELAWLLEADATLAAAGVVGVACLVAVALATCRLVEEAGVLEVLAAWLTLVVLLAVLDTLELVAWLPAELV